MGTSLRASQPGTHEASAPGRSFQHAALVIGISVFLYVFLVIYHTAPYDYNLSSLIRIGAANPFFTPSVLDEGTVVFIDRRSGGDGYDGQFYLYMIKDLLMGEDGIPNPFRFQRILYPVLVWMFALGRAELLPASMLFVNLAAIALSALLLWKLLRETEGDGDCPKNCGPRIFGRRLGTVPRADLRPEHLFIYTLNVGFLVAVFYDVATPLCVALIVAAAYFYWRDRMWLASLMMALSLLAQENGGVVLVALGAWLLARKELKKALILGLSVAPWAAWQIILWARYGHLPFIMSGNHLRPPFMGMISQLSSQALSGNWVNLLRELSVYPMMLFVLALLAVSAIEMKKNPSPFMLVLLVHGLIGVCFNREQIWSSTISSSARALAGVFPFLVICCGQTRSRRMLALIALSALLTALGILRIFLMPPHPFIIS